MIELVATFYGWTYHYILYKLTFAQAISMVRTRTEREKKQQQRAESKRPTKSDGSYDELSDISDLVMPDPAKPETLPYIDEVLDYFSGTNMMSR